MAKWFRCCAACVALTVAAGVGLSQQQAQDDRKIPEPDPKKGKAVARVYDEYIYPKELGAKDGELSDEAVSRLQAAIMKPLLRRYAEEYKITVEPKEVEQFTKFLGSAPLPEGGKDAPKVSKEEVNEFARTLGREMVRRWKVDRSLYKRYGGTVIFQQANPQEPVGAYRKFLEEREKEKAFEIFDEKARERFYHYFTRDHGSWVVPEKRVDFDTPWWLRAKQGKDSDKESDRARP
jgi:hypothetical protein